MTEQEFQKEIGEIKGELESIRKNTRNPLWRSFVNGMLSALGYAVGLAIALVIVGWLLNVAGVIPALKEKVNSWQQTLDSLQNNR